MEAITVTRLSKFFNRKYAVQELDMHVPEGVIYGFIGQNGAGKSTTQKMLCGLLVPTSGEISIWGKPVNDADVRSRMGVLIEEPGVYKGWIARENLLMQALNLGIENPRQAVDEALEIVGLSDTGKKKVKQFSLGMRQRLGIAAAFLGNPNLLILDEPINGLDPEGIREVRQILLQLNEKHHVTILISSHILGELSKIATHYGIIKNGRMVKEISAEDLSKECRDYMRVKTEHPERVLPYLQKEIAMSGGEVAGGELRLYNVKDGAAVSRCMFEHGDAVGEISFHQLDLEEYFMSLMGGEKMHDLFTVKAGRIRNLFRMDLHRMLHGKAFYVMIIVAIYLPVMLIAQMGGTTNIMAFIEGSGSFESFGTLLVSMSNVLTGLLLCIYIGQEYPSGCIKGIVTAHANKFDYILSKGLIALICNVVFTVVYLLAIFVAGSVLGMDTAIPSVIGLVCD